MKEKGRTLMQKMENLTKMTNKTWPYERIEDKTKFCLVKEHFSFGFESLGLRLREKRSVGDFAPCDQGFW